MPERQMITCAHSGLRYLLVRGKIILNIVIIQRNEITGCYDYSNNSDITLPMM